MQIFRKFIQNIRGFSATEVVFAAVISGAVIAAILAVWVFSYKSWVVENQRTQLRVDLMKTLETVRNDIRLSSLTYISLYPAGGEPFSAISLPVAELDANGFFDLNANDEIVWDKTVIYHTVTDVSGNMTLEIIP